MLQGKELDVGLRPSSDELFGPGSDTFPTSRSSHLAPGEFSALSPLGIDRLALSQTRIKPETSDNGDSPK